MYQPGDIVYWKDGSDFYKGTVVGLQTTMEEKEYNNLSTSTSSTSTSMISYGHNYTIQYIQDYQPREIILHESQVSSTLPQLEIPTKPFAWTSSSPSSTRFYSPTTRIATYDHRIPISMLINPEKSKEQRIEIDMEKEKQQQRSLRHFLQPPYSPPHFASQRKVEQSHHELISQPHENTQEQYSIAESRRMLEESNLNKKNANNNNNALQRHNSLPTRLPSSSSSSSDIHVLPIPTNLSPWQIRLVNEILQYTPEDFTCDVYYRMSQILQHEVNVIQHRLHLEKMIQHLQHETKKLQKENHELQYLHHSSSHLHLHSSKEKIASNLHQMYNERHNNNREKYGDEEPSQEQPHHQHSQHSQHPEQHSQHSHPQRTQTLSQSQSHPHLPPGKYQL